MEKTIDILETIQEPSALTQEQGEIVFQIICNIFDNKDSVTLDFKNIESMISPFLNTAIGQLYGRYSSDIIREYLHLKNFPDEKRSTLKIVIENAKRYYANKQQYNATVEDAIG